MPTDRDYHEAGLSEEHIKRLTPTREVPQPADIPTREVGSAYLKPGDKVRLRDSERVGEVVSIEDRQDVMVKWEDDEAATGYYDIRDLVKRA